MSRGLLAGLLACVLGWQPAAAITFSFTTIEGDSLSTDQASAFNTAAAAWSAVLSDTITVNLQVGFRSLGANTLGGSSPTLVNLSASAVKARLLLDRTSGDDNAAVASLPNYAANTSLALTTAQAKAIGFSETGTDSIIEFSSDYNFQLARNADGTVDAGKFDFVGIAEHEIGHALAFVSSIDFGLPSQTLLDQFRYGAPGSRSVASGASAYFSIDNGTTNTASFSQGGSGNYQASHWLQGTRGLMDPAIGSGAVQNITTLDMRAFDVLGYNLQVPVPEPDSLVLLAAGLLAVVAFRRRNA